MRPVEAKHVHTRKNTLLINATKRRRRNKIDQVMVITSNYGNENENQRANDR